MLEQLELHHPEFYKAFEATPLPSWCDGNEDFDGDQSDWDPTTIPLDTTDDQSTIKPIDLAGEEIAISTGQAMSLWERFAGKRPR